jgi:single-strand DNA-binding protein
MNKVILTGRLCGDPELMTTPTGTAVTKYRLAVDRPSKRSDGKREADFISCVTFGKNAEFASRYLTKGTKIAVVGRIQTGSYQKDGATIYTTDVIVEEHEFCESKRMSGGNSPVQSPADNVSVTGFTPDYAPNLTEISDDTLPF